MNENSYRTCLVQITKQKSNIRLQTPEAAFTIFRWQEPTLLLLGLTHVKAARVCDASWYFDQTVGHFWQVQMLLFCAGCWTDVHIFDHNEKRRPVPQKRNHWNLSWSLNEESFETDFWPRNFFRLRGVVLHHANRARISQATHVLHILVHKRFVHLAISASVVKESSLARPLSHPLFVCSEVSMLKIPLIFGSRLISIKIGACRVMMD